MYRDSLYAYLVRPDSLEIWRYNEVREKLKWYYSVMLNEKPAKYLIAKRIPLPTDIGVLSTLDEDSLWDLHHKLRVDFKKRWVRIKEEKEDLKEYPVINRSFLDLKVELVYRLLSPCRICEHKCMVDRKKGRRGICGLDSVVRVSAAFLHLGEEAPLVPSGTIFFTGCSLKCVFCQNFDISRNPFNGVEVDGYKLAELSKDLAKRGARNINYVGGNPDQNMHVILDSLKYMNVNIPLLWNSNFYMTKESMDLLLDVIDIWLPDFKYGNDNCAFRLSRVKNYFKIVSRNHKLAYNYGDNMIIRHLVLPGHVNCCTKIILDWISKNLPNAMVNIMDQYRPEYMVIKDSWRFKDINRRLYRKEIEKAYQYAEEKGICYKYIS